MRSYFDGMLRYFEFSGRTTRLQYWMYFAIYALLGAAAVIFDLRFGTAEKITDLTSMPVTLFFVLVHIIPNATVQVRRLHDIGKSGAWYLLSFVPLGGLLLLYWACCASEDGENYYGPDPRDAHFAPPKLRAAKPAYSSIPRTIRMGTAPTASATSPRRTDDGVQRFI